MNPQIKQIIENVDDCERALVSVLPIGNARIMKSLQNIAKHLDEIDTDDPRRPYLDLILYLQTIELDSRSLLYTAITNSFTKDTASKYIALNLYKALYTMPKLFGRAIKALKVRGGGYPGIMKEVIQAKEMYETLKAHIQSDKEFYTFLEKTRKTIAAHSEDETEQNLDNLIKWTKEMNSGSDQSYKVLFAYINFYHELMVPIIDKLLAPITAERKDM